MKLKDFDWRISLCKLQHYEPTACPEVKEDCPVYIEYNTSKSAQHPTSEGENVR